MMPRFWPMCRKEFIQMRRDRLTLGVMTGIPVLQLLLFGFAIQTDVRHLPTVVVDESATPESRDVIAAPAIAPTPPAPTREPRTNGESPSVRIAYSP